MNWRRGAVLLAALLACALTARLGWWQLERAAHKTALHAARADRLALPVLRMEELATDAAQVPSQLHRRVELGGQWLAQHTVYLDNRQMNGRAGFYAVTPLRLPDGSAVLVQRGWLPRHRSERTLIAAVPPAPGPVQVQGRIAQAAAQQFELGAAATGLIRQNLGVPEFARETGLAMRPLVVVQEDGATAPADGLLRQWPQVADGVGKHHGYAFQWFSLSALIAGLYVWFQILRPARERARALHQP
jgi:surfeit locus 1 family protein